jgi:DNA-binding CsgD family transcriptional regulator
MTVHATLQLDAPSNAAFYGKLSLALLDSLTFKVFFVRADSSILYANTRASALLSERSVVIDRGGRLSGLYAGCTQQLRFAISYCASDAVSPHCSGIPVLLNTQDDQSLIVWVLPLGRRCAQETKCAAVLIRNPRETFSHEAFTKRFSTTCAETRVMGMLFSGLALSEVSDVLDISKSTVKTHLRNLFSKTGVSRQTDLLRVASECAAPASMRL